MNRSAKTPIDLPIVGLLALIGLAVLALFAFAVGAPQLVELALWAGVPRYVAWLTPVVVDGALVAYSVAAAVQRSRSQRAGLMWLALVGFTGLSVAAQVVHALATGHAPTAAALWVSVALAASLPLAVLVGVEAVISVAVSSPMPRKKAAKASPDKKAEVVRPSVANADANNNIEDTTSTPALALVKTKQPRTNKTARDERIRELTATGMSSRDVATRMTEDGTPVSAATVLRVIKEAA